ncbi:MAG: glycerol-3-phosphate dehydrogenase/oxidase [Bacteroidales bacterium]|nr:glycerol-3-phosphate dehydrogenase/oxidase [Bacteroidales bacterium]
MVRSRFISDLQNNINNVWDVIVIGGGATGTGLALDAATRGYRTLLLEKSDFGSGTSSRSTKLVHGGVRYLAKGDLLLVIEALRERGHMLRNAPGLTNNQEFVIPLYTYWDVLLYYVGLKFYDILSGTLSLGKSHYIGRSKTIERLPTIKTEGLKGGIVYHDGQFDDARMTIALAAEATLHGAVVLNYFSVSGLIKDTANHISGVTATDIITGSQYRIMSKLVINATGVFADNIHRLDDHLSEPTLRPSQGVHIVLDRSFLMSDTAIMIPKTSDGRVLFAIPWHDKVVAGTTDTPLDEVMEEPVALDNEIDFILNTAGNYLTRAPARSDVLSVFAGLRPLAAGRKETKSTKEISRRHRIDLSDSGLLTVTGGKWTTYRCMAEETIDRGIRAGLIEKRKCITKNLPIGFGFGIGSILPDGVPLHGDNPIPKSGRGPAIPHHPENRLTLYGQAGAEAIADLIGSDPSMAETIAPGLPYTIAEILWIIRNEMPCRLDDILSRRTRSLILDARASIEAAPRVAQLMARELGYDRKWEYDAVADYIALAIRYL